MNGEPIPEEVKILLDHASELALRTGIEPNWREGWATWVDTRYLTEADRGNPDIVTNVR